MAWHVLELVLLTGAIGPSIFAAAYLLWRCGVRDPFILTVAAIVIGTGAGWLLNSVIGKWLDRRNPRLGRHS